MQKTSFKAYKGTSIVSLLVGMVLSAFLILVLLQTYYSIKENYRLSNNMIAIGDEARYISRVLSEAVSNAGYRNPSAGVLPLLTTAYPARTIYSGLDVEAGTYVIGYDAKLIVGVQGNGQIKDCSGAIIPANTVTYMAFEKDSSQFLCNIYPQSGEVRQEVLSKMVNNKVFLYGIDNNNDGQTDRYLIIGEVTNWKRVRTVKINLILKGEEPVYYNEQSKTFTIPGYGDIVVNSTKLCKQIQLTIPLLHLPESLP